MSNSVDEKIVHITFDNNQFERGVAQSRDSLGRFTKSLQDMPATTKGLSDVAASAGKIKFDGARDSLGKFTTDAEAADGKLSFKGLASGLDSIENKFKGLSVVGITAISNLVNRAVDAGISFTKAFTIDPIKAGFQNYETQIKATQTILANTASQGVKIGQVNKVLAELNTYANQTVYNFSDMTKNIGTFTAAGVGLQASVNSIKGIANLAAMSGSTSEQASTAMYQLSQAIAAGSVHLQDWNSVVNAGLGGKTFQTALENTARASGVAIDSIIKKQGGFRQSLEKGWLTSDILTKTLSQFTGDLSLKQIKAMGYTTKQAEDILKLGKVAVDSATKIKTFSQLTDALKEEVATAYAAIFKTIFGGIGEATDLFTNIHNVAENALTKPIYSLNTLLQGWDKLGGRKVLIDGLTLALQAMEGFLKPIAQAFREVFPPETAQELYNLTTSFHVFAENLLILPKTADELKRTFAGLFAIISIGWAVIKQVVKTIFDLVGSATAGSSGILNFTARIGDWLVNLNKAVQQGTAFNNFFVDLRKYLQVPITYLREFGAYIGTLIDKFNSFNGVKVESGLVGIATKLGPIGVLGKIVQDAWGKLVSILPAVARVFEPIAAKLSKFFSGLGQAITQGLSQMNFSDVLNTINTLLFGGIVLLFKNFTTKFLGGGLGGAGGGLVHAITESFDGLTGTLKTMQGTLKAATLLEIAVAIGLLTISVSQLAKIDSGGLQRSLTAMGAMFAELLSAMAIFQKVVGTQGFLKMPIISLAFIGLAIAIDLMTGALTRISKIPVEQLRKGLDGLGILLGELVATVKLMPPGAGLISTSIALTILAGGIQILVNAVAKLGALSWTQLSKGLIGVGTLLGSLALFTKFAKADAGGVLQGAGIILLATGIRILVSAVQSMGSMSWSEIGKGLAALAGVLVLVGAALTIIPPTAPLAAAGILITAVSLGMVAQALKVMGEMSWGAIGKSMVELGGALLLIGAALTIIPPTAPLSAAGIYIVAISLGKIASVLQVMGAMSWVAIGKSMVVLGGSLLLISLAMIAMTEALPGAAALFIVSASLLTLTPVLQAFGQMSWSEIGKSLLMLAGVFVVLGLAGLVLTPVVPTLIGLGVAITLLGIGMLAAGGGLLLFSTALTALSISGAAGAAAIVGIVTALVGLIPVVMKEIGLGIVAFAKTISTAGPAILSAIETVLDALLGAIVHIIPAVVTALYKLLTSLLDTMNKYVPHLVDAGGKLITSILNGIANHIGGIIAAATRVVVNFINGIAAALPKIIQAGVNLILAFINGVANAIRSNSHAMGAAGANLGTSIIEGMVSGLAGGIGKIVSEAKNIANSAINAAKSALDINSPSKEFIKIGQSVNEGFLNGLKSGNRAAVDKAITDMSNQLVTAMNDSSRTVESLTKKLHTLTTARHQDRTEIAETRKELAQAKKEHADEYAAYEKLNKTLKTSHTTLDKLATQYSTLTTKINAANDALANAIKVRDDYNTQTTQQYEVLPTISDTTTVTDYTASLQKQVEDTKEFANTLARLRKLGLSDDAYKQLVAGGTADLPFAQQLLAGGQTAVNQVNDLDKQLDAAATGLGKTASSDLYQAAVDSAQGLVDGLKKQQAAIQAQMDKIAAGMVAAIKKALGIKSPSKVFAEIGEFTGAGLEGGLNTSAIKVAKAAGAMGNAAVTSLSKSLTGMSDLISGPVQMRPVITPVLDLSDVKKGAGQIGGMLSVQPIPVDAAFNKASTISSSVMSTSTANSGDGTAAQPVVQQTTTYNQYNTSPKALSATEIYRQTKNQLSQEKGAVTASAKQG